MRMPQHTLPGGKHMRIREVRRKLGDLSSSAFFVVRRSPRFPDPIAIIGRSPLWSESSIETWLESLPRGR